MLRIYLKCQKCSSAFCIITRCHSFNFPPKKNFLFSSFFFNALRRAPYGPPSTSTSQLMFKLVYSFFTWFSLLLRAILRVFRSKLRWQLFPKKKKNNGNFNKLLFRITPTSYADVMIINYVVFQHLKDERSLSNVEEWCTVSWSKENWFFFYISFKEFEITFDTYTLYPCCRMKLNPY